MSEGETAVGPSVSEEIKQRISGFLGVSNEDLEPVLAHNTLKERLALKAQAFYGLQSTNLRLHATVDELKSLCTSKVDSLKSEVERLTRENDSGKQARNDLEDKLGQLTKEKTLALGQLENAKCELQNTIEQSEVLKSNKQEVVKLLEEKISELEASKQESQEVLNENKKLRHQLLEFQNQVQVLKSDQLGEKSELEVAKQQINLLTKNNEWLEKEVTVKTEQLIKYRQQNDTELQHSLQELATLRSNYQLEKSAKEFLVKKNEEMAQDLQSKLLEVKRLSDTLSAETQEFSREMALKQKLLDLQEEQLQSLKDELRINEEKLDHNNTDDSQPAEQTKLAEDLAQLRQRLEESEHERLRLESLVKDLVGSNEDISSDLGANFSIQKLYADLSILRKQFIKERHQKESLQRQIETFVVELEYKVPVINSLKERSFTLEKELSDIALLLEHTSNEKEKKARELESALGKIKQFEMNTHTLIRQRADLARQVQFLLFNSSLQNDSRGALTPEESDFIKKIMNNEDPSVESDSQSIITERLVEFKNISSLQARNEELLKTVRNLADKLEEEERNANTNVDSIEQRTIDEAKEAIVALQERNSEIEAKVLATEKERDAYKAVISQKEQGFTNGHDPLKVNGKAENEDLIRKLEEQLSVLTSEASKNNQLLNEELRDLYKSKSHITVSYEKERSSRIFVEERLKLLQSTLEMTKSENKDFAKRTHELQAILSKQESRNAETVNKFISCQSKVSVLESKASNLEAEKSLLQSSVESLRKELQKISEERNSLELLVAQLQTLQTEHESVLKESQKAHNAAITQLESQASELKADLVSKSGEIKAIEEARDTQVKWYQDRIDIMTTEASQTREQLAAKAATIAQLELRVSDLEKRLQESDLCISTYKTLADATNGETVEGQLRKDLEKTKLELKHAYSQIEEFKQEAFRAEEDLKKLNEEFQERKEALESNAKAQLDEKNRLEANVLKLKQNIDFLNNEYALQKNRSEEEKNEILKRLAPLESKELSSIGIKDEYEQKLNQLKKDLEQQTSYANEAQKNYEEELQKHAEVSKTISQLRSEVQNDKSEIEKLKRSEERANNVLENSEKSWLTQKSELENLLGDMKQQVENLSRQNKLLFDQVELLSKGDGEPDVKLSPENRELLVNLRRERDILEVKLNVSKREERSLRQKQLVLEDELAEARKKLFNLQKSETNHSDFIKRHQEIMEQLNQMNLLRESNITLRNATDAAQEKIAVLQNELDDLQGKILPLNSEITQCRQSVAEKDQRIKMLIDEVDRWKERSHSILRRHEQIDPEEFKKKEEEIVSLREQLEAKSKENTDLNDRFTRLKKQAHEKLNASKVAQANLSAELNEINETKTKMEETLKERQDKVLELERMLNEKNGDSVTIDNLRSELESVHKRSKEIESKLEETVHNSEELTSQLNSQIAALEEEVRSLKEKENAFADQDSVQDLSNVVESMKKAFEDEKIKFIQDKTEEYNKKFEEQKAKLLSDSSSASPGADSVDVESLKKQWEAEYEALSLKRIQEAEENLKKRIRMPTEERIKKVLDKRKAELEEEFQHRLQEKGLKTEAEAGDNKEHENLKKEIENELESKYKEILTSTRKKAFEEGKQQAAMKSTLLERKISKLESQLGSIKGSSVEKAGNVSNSGFLSKVDENRTDDAPTMSPAFGEKVLKLSDKPAFAIKPSSAGNPFTSTLPVNDNVFGMKPAFSLAGASSQKGSGPTFGSTGFNTLAASGDTTASQAKEVLSDEHSTAEGRNPSFTEQSKEVIAPVASAQKRPAEEQPDDDSTHKREKQESP